MMFAGNRMIAMTQIEALILKAAKDGLAPRSTWQYPSEIKMLAVLEQKSHEVVQKLITDETFFDLPNLDCWRAITQRGDTRFPSEEFCDLALAEFSTLWETPQHKRIQSRLKSIRVELTKLLTSLENAWRQRDYEQTTATKKKTRKKRGRTSRSASGLSTSDRSIFDYTRSA